jgi:hypothetical protein
MSRQPFWQISCTQTRIRKATLLDLLCCDLPPRFLPVGTPYPFAEKGRCRWCGGLVEPPRRTWCSDECVDAWGILTSSAIVRSAVWKRDHGICAQCGHDATKYTRTDGSTVDVGMWGEWDADHIVPVWKGGGLCGLDNYQTLCRDCHAAKTAADAAERAVLRRPDPEPDPYPQLELVLA